MNFYGINTMKRENKVMDEETPDGRNFIITDNRLKTRAGFEKENSAALGSFARAIIDFKSDKCNVSNIIVIENDGTVITYPPLPQPTYIVGQWQLEEVSGNVSDISGNSNHGSVSGALYQKVGRVNNCLEFDGVDDYINVPHSASLDITGDMTLSAWIYPTNFGDATHYPAIITKATGDTASDTYWDFYISADSNNGLVYDERNGANFASVTKENVFSLNGWHHVVLVVSSNTRTIYVDGQSVATSNFGWGLFTVSAPVRMGNINNPTLFNNTFQGKIDEVIVWNVALTAAEIMDYYTLTNKDLDGNPV